MSYLLGTDIGTLGTKTVVVDAEGNVKGTASQECSNPPSRVG
jgi:sugar (pentulose or hexulose) kinase